MPRFSYALLGALALHGLLLLHRARPSRAAEQSAVERALSAVELEEFPIEELPLEAPLEPSAPSAVAAGAEARVAAHALSRSAAQPESLASAEPTNTAAPEPEALAEPGAAAVLLAEAGDARPARKIDLGLDGHFFLHAPTGAASSAPAAAEPAAASELGPRARKSTVQRQLEAAISAADVQRGLSRGGALVGSLNSAARSAGPLRGEAIIRATIGADGSFGAVELLRGDTADWSAVLGAFRQLAARKQLRLPPGAKGLRVTFSVKAKVQRPSGADARDTAVQVGDPSLGKDGLVPQAGFDLADLGGAAQRVVYARVVAEEVL